ncbi:MAG: hypothetical protein ABI810_05900, partial [Sphingomonas bacterium]
MSLSMVTPNSRTPSPRQPLASRNPFRHRKGGKAAAAALVGRGRKNGRPSASLIACIAGWSNA